MGFFRGGFVFSILFFGGLFLKPFFPGGNFGWDCFQNKTFFFFFPNQQLFFFFGRGHGTHYTQKNFFFFFDIFLIISAQKFFLGMK